MASPWTFFARLVPLQRQKRDKTRQTDGVGPGMSEIANSGEHPVGMSTNSSDVLGDEKLNPYNRSESRPAQHGSSEEGGDDFQESIEEQRADRVTALRSDRPGIAVSATPSASRVNKRLETAPLKRKRRARAAKNDEVVSRSSNRVPENSNEVAILDQEIMALRGQLVTKLHLQNAQLKTMLERFERITGISS